MIYVIDPYYWRQTEFPRQEAEITVAEALAPFAVSYEARVMAPRKGMKDTRRSGTLPADAAERANFIQETIAWIHENSITADLFCLRLATADQDPKAEVGLFDHHDTGSDWFLNLDQEQLAALQAALRKANLPEDLFYSQDKTVFKPYKLFGLIPFGETMYSPNELKAFEGLR